MVNEVLNKTNQAFINNNLDSDIHTLLLKNHKNNEIDIKLLIEQIESKKRCLNKLPTWYKSKNIYYPNRISIEQTSSEITAAYKANIISGNTLIDLTGGFGVDSYYFSKQFKTVIHCEIDKDLSEIVTHNYDILNITNIKCLNEDGISYLKKSKLQYDWIYADPSRRHMKKGKVFKLDDCLPNIPENIENILEKTINLLIKTSPLLDLSIGIKELKFVKAIHVIAINNEVKELLWEIEKSFNENIEIKTVNILKNNIHFFNFSYSDESKNEATYELPKEFLFEPNSAIMKSGAFNSISNKLNVAKLHKHSHLYTSSENIEFPGRRFKIVQVLDYNKNSIAKLNIKKANITTRNFSETVQSIRKKFKITDGGETYLFFTTDIFEKKVIIICKKLT